MFKGKIHIYKNVDGKEEEIKKEFDSEKDFDMFMVENPELKRLWDWRWKPMRWPALSWFDDFWEETKMLGDESFIEDIEDDLAKMEKEMTTIFDRSKKLLGR